MSYAPGSYAPGATHTAFVVMLESAGHYPLEQPGLSQMVHAIDAFYRDGAAR
ncbi:hypothetical protein AB4Y45_17000 [Paraburkholderia sp. EG287A]|uniref:hypothetical protein n=1 Tax=unclassified Paraburkholderia TaxID=2615204 RepID=UPI0034D1F662